MSTRRSYLSILGLALMMTAAAVFAAPTGDATAIVGEKAPNFTLADAEGTEYSLSDYKGKIVVLQWINPDCPVCHRVHKSGLVKKMNEKLTKIDSEIVVLDINSTKNTKVDKSAKYLAKYKIDVTALSDLDGTVGKMYGARTTPHVFVIDGEGVLRYQGAFDSDPVGKSDDTTNYVINAVMQITEGETVTPDSTKPYGCSVKYASD